MSRIGVISLGCAKNLVDTEIGLGFLVGAGHQIVSDPYLAQTIIINTCGFIDTAKEESISTILEMAALKEQGLCKNLIVMGCLSQRYAQELWGEIPEIDGLLGANEWDLLPWLVEQLDRGERVFKIRQSLFNYDQVYSRLSTTGSHFAYLKIAEGCNHSCAFCVIPQIRGVMRSREPETILAEAKQLVQLGVQEIAVIAQDTTAYGSDLDSNIVELMRRLTSLDVPWIRLLYTYPTAISDSLLDLMRTTDNFVKYVDLPLQHVAGPVLKRMRRPGDLDSSVALIERIREQVPGVVLRSSFIVGFPGETETEFEQLLRFLEQTRLNHVGIFKYSREENSLAYGLEAQISERIKERRYQEAMALQQQISLDWNQKLVGQDLQVLLEFPSPESDLVLVGRHAAQAPDVDGVVYVGRGSLQVGQMVNLRITAAYPYDLVGEEVNNEPA